MKGNAFMTVLIFHCKGYLEWLSTNWAEHFAEKTSSANPPHPAGHRAQHGGVRLHGLRDGRDGTSTVGRTKNGQRNGE